VSLALSFAATNWFTRRILKNNDEYRVLLEQSETTTGVVSRLVWTPSFAGKSTAWIVKHLSLMNILAVLWFEFSVAGDLVRGIVPPFAGAASGSIAVFACCLVVVFLIVRFGLRGFVFADLFQSPLIIIGTAAVLIAMLSDPTVQMAIQHIEATPL